MTYTIKITNKNTDPNSKTADTIYFDSISPSLIIDPDTSYAEFIKDMTIRDGSICIPLWERQQFVRIPPNSVLIINTDDSSEAIYYRQMTVNNTAILVDPDPIQGSSGGGTLIEKTIMENGTYNAVDDGADGYSTVNVEVENSYTAEDNGKVVNNQALVTQTAYPNTITENDTYDTTNYNSITVNVSGGGSSSVVAICTFSFSEHQFLFEDESETIGDDVFYNLDELTSVTIPNSVTSIGNSAFQECYSLETVTFEANSSLESIGGDAFWYCQQLTSITIPNSVTSIGDYAFHNCSTLPSITIPSNVTSIGNSAFQDCISLETVTFEANSSLESIGSYVFNSCHALTSITIPSSVTSIGDYAFDGCQNLETVTFEANSSLESIGNRAFSECYALTSITIPSGVTSIGSDAIYDCISLETVTFESTIPPTLDGSLGFPANCTIRVPQGTLLDYTSADYYPDPDEYTYEEY